MNTLQHHCVISLWHAGEAKLDKKTGREEAPAFGGEALSDVDGELFVLLKNGYPLYGYIMYTISMLYVIQLSISNCSGLPGFVSISGSFDKPVASAFSYPAGMFNAWN